MMQMFKTCQRDLSRRKLKIFTCILLVFPTNKIFWANPDLDLRANFWAKIEPELDLINVFAG